MKNYYSLTFKALFLALLWLSPGLSERSARAQTADEQVLEAKIKKQLEAVLGEGKAHVSVSGQQTPAAQRREKTYSDPQILHESIQTEKDSSGHERSQRKTQWINNQSESLTQQSTKLKQKSVSVIYDPPEASEDNPTPLSEQQIKELVAAVADLESENGDQVHVQAGNFSDSAYERLKAEMEKAEQGVPWWIFGMIGLLSLMLGGGMMYLILSRRNRALATLDSTALYPTYAPATPVAEPVAGSFNTNDARQARQQSSTLKP